MALIERTSDDGIAHGLRQHSIGGTFPAVVVGRGDGSTEVHLGQHVRDGLSVSQAYKLAEVVGEYYRRSGWNNAVAILKTI